MAIRKIVSRALTDSLNVDSGTLVVDDANNRVGIGTATPSVDLDIQTTGSGTKLNIASTGNGINADLTDASATSRIRHVGTILDLGADYTNTAVSDPRIRFRVGNTPQCSINAHGGIAFGNDLAAENTLSDYEQGTWTPAYATSGGGESVTYTGGSGQIGIYTKIGNLVTCHFNLDINSSSNIGSGSVQVTGLPFPSGSQSYSSNYNRTNFSTYGISHVTTAGSERHFYIPSTGYTYMQILYSYSGGTWGIASTSDFNIGSGRAIIVCGSFSYYTDS